MKHLIAVLLMFIMVGCASNLQPQGQWQSVSYTGSPHPRHESAFIAFKDKFYALGGRRIQPVDIFDPKTQSWTQGAKPPFELHHFQPVVYQDAIILAGAMTGPYPNEIPVPNLIYYYPEQDRWEIGEPLPNNRLRGSAGTVIHKNRLYLISGIKQGHYSGHVPWLDVFDLEARQWSKLASAPRSRDHFQASVLDGKIYAVGGRNTSQKTNQVFYLTIPEVDVYDIETNRWTTLPKGKNLPTKRAGSMTLTLGDEIWIFGGETQRISPAHNEVEVYNPKTNNWKIMPGFKEGRHGTGVLFYKGELWTALGSGARGGKPELNSMEKLTFK